MHNSSGMTGNFQFMVLGLAVHAAMIGGALYANVLCRKQKSC